MVRGRSYGTTTKGICEIWQAQSSKNSTKHYQLGLPALDPEFCFTFFGHNIADPSFFVTLPLIFPRIWRVNSACSSALVAVVQGASAIVAGQCVRGAQGQVSLAVLGVFRTCELVKNKVFLENATFPHHGTPWKINGWNIIIGVWFRSFSFLFMGDGCMFQPFIFQGVREYKPPWYPSTLLFDGDFSILRKRYMIFHDIRSESRPFMFKAPGGWTNLNLHLPRISWERGDVSKLDTILQAAFHPLLRTPRMLQWLELRQLPFRTWGSLNLRNFGISVNMAHMDMPLKGRGCHAVFSLFMNKEAFGKSEE